MRALYHIALWLYDRGIGLFAFWNPKARMLQRGRKTVWDELSALSEEPSFDVWMHCASQGEYEQGAPVLRLIREENPDFRLLLTFFSPSGYEQQKENALADEVAYLPTDYARNAREFLRAIRPGMAIFVKKEVWPNYLLELKKQRVPSFLISARFTRFPSVFNPWSWLFRRAMSVFEGIYVQDELSVRVLNHAGITRVKQMGNPRIERVLDLKNEVRNYPAIERFKDGKPMIIFGSVWSEDLSLVRSGFDELIRQGWKLLLAPHEIHSQKIDKLVADLNAYNSVRYTEFMKNGHSLTRAQVLILDTIGDLKYAYRYGEIAYVGGGFGKGIHSILEPGAYGLPVVFGPKYRAFQEAEDWVQNEWAFAVGKATEWKTIIATLTTNSDVRQKIGQGLSTYFQANVGAAARLVTEIKKWY